MAACGANLILLDGHDMGMLQSYESKLKDIEKQKHEDSGFILWGDGGSAPKMNCILRMQEVLTLFPLILTPLVLLILLMDWIRVLIAHLGAIVVDVEAEVAAADVADAEEDKNKFMDYTSDPIWLRIDGLIFDDNSHPLTFSKRLARENRWAHWFALDVMEEYKKFLYLMAVSDHPVTPSIEVDQVWHLHLYIHTPILE